MRGRIVGVRPTWTSEAVVDADGFVTAPDKTGVYVVEAAVGALKASAKLTVSAGAARTVRVLPGSSGVKPRDRVEFSAAAFDAWGNSVAATPLWRVTFGTGTIDQQGTFIAGTSGTSAIAAEVDGVVASASVTAECVPPRTETTAGLTFTIVCGTFADVWLNGAGLDAGQVAKTIDQAVSSVESTVGRTLRHRLKVNVFATQENYAEGLRQLVGVDPSPFEEGVFVPPALIAINWSAPDVPEAIARHEITHLVVDEIARGTVPVPYWLHEGLATMSEFPVSEDSALISRYCAASAAKNSRLPTLSEIATPRGWRTYVNEVGVAAYFVAAQIASFMASDARGQANLLEKMAGGLPVESAYAAASGRSFETFAAELPDRARQLADPYPGVAVTRRLLDGSVVYVAYGEPADSLVRIEIRNIFNPAYSASGSMLTTHFGCLAGYLDSAWPRGSYLITASGVTGRASATLQR